MRHHQYKAIALFFTLLLAGRIGAQETSEFRWARTFRGESCDAYSIESIFRTMWDSAGNLYVYGAAAPGAEWNGRRMLDSDTLTWQHCKMSLFVAKIDTCGNMVWCKSARGSSRENAMNKNSCYEVCDMDMRDGKIYIFGKLAFSPDERWKRDSAWLFFFDTLYKGVIDYSDPWYYDIHGYPFESSEVKRYHSIWHFFAVFDLEGNLIDRHSFYLSKSDGVPPNYLKVAGSETLNEGRFRIDSEGNVCMFANIAHTIEWDSTVRPYMVVAEDTTRTHIQLFPPAYHGPMQTLFLKFDTNWNLVERKPLLDYSYGNHVHGLGGLTLCSMDIDEDDNFYFSGYAGDFKSRRSYPQDSLPLYLYMDSSHSLKFEGRLMQMGNTPFMAKYDSGGNLLWLTQSAYMDWTIDSSLWRINPGKCHNDSTAAYTTLTVFPGINNNVYPDEPYMHLFYFDSAHTDTFPDLRRQNGGSAFYYVDQMLAFDKETGELTQHWLLDSVSAESCRMAGADFDFATKSLPWENSVATVKFSRVEYGAFDLVKVNLDNDSVTQGQRIWFSGGNVNIHPEGWMLRESQVVAGGSRPEWMFTGSDTVVSGNHIVSLYYDSTLDLRRRYTCPAPTGITATRTTDSTAWVTWDPAEGNALWVVSHGPEGAQPEEGILDTVTGVPAITLSGLDSNTRYEVFVKAVCEYTPRRFPGYQGSYPTRPPLSGWAGPVGLDTLTSGISDVEEDKPFFTLTPNPTDGKVAVEVNSEKLKDKSGEATITVCDATGREVMTRKASILNSQLSILNLEALPAGTYFVTVTIGGQSGTRKLVVK